MRFFPFVFSLFMFVLFANLLGLLPFSYTVTSQIVVTFALAGARDGHRDHLRHRAARHAFPQPVRALRRVARSSCRSSC